MSYYFPSLVSPWVFFKQARACPDRSVCGVRLVPKQFTYSLASPAYPGY
ncbi:MAG: hypothetical protein IPH16_20515 [Haliscomenobacter sp.]|nr:hypothetical protein [Haliscomenobacter sp.]